MKRRRLVGTLALLAAVIGQSSLGFYNPATGRWLNRDPVGEPGFLAVFQANQIRESTAPLYLFVENEPIGMWDYLGLLVDTPTASFLSALAQGAWGQAWTILEVTASNAGRAAWISAYTRAVSASVALNMGPAVNQANRAWHIVRPEHQWCRLVPLVNNVPANAVANFQRVQSIIAQAWSQGTTLVAAQTGGVVKEATIQGQRVMIQGRVLLDESGVVEIVDAWVIK